MSKRSKWLKKDSFDGEWVKDSCAYCYFDCPFEVCDRRDYFCDCFEPNISLDI